MWKPKVVHELLENAARARADHKARHRPTGFGFAFADRVGYLHPEHWDSLVAAASVFLQRRYLAVVEAHGPTNLTGRYAMIFRGDRPVAALAAQVARLKGRDLVGGSNGAGAEAAGVKKALKRASSRIKSHSAKQINAKVLVCGNLLSWGLHGVAFAPGEDAAELWPAVAEALYRMRRAEKLSSHVDLLMIKDVPDMLAAHAAPLRRFSYDAVATDPDMVLELSPTWKTHGDYLGALERKYRKATAKVMEQIASAGFALEGAGSLEAHGARIHELYLHVHQRAAVRPFTLQGSFIPALAAAMGDGFRCSLIRRGEEIAGFVTTLKDGDTAIGYYLGYDPAVNQEVPVYFGLLQAVVADAIALGCTRLSLGRTALEPKARLGAKPVPMKIYLRHRQPILNKMLRPLLGLVPHDEAPDRNPFK